MQTSNKEDVFYAGFFVRLSAYAIDWLIVSFLLLIVRIPKLVLYLVNSDSLIFKQVLFKFSAIDIIIYLLGLAYFVIMTYFYGATLGKKLFNLKVYKSNDEKLSLVDVIYRESIGRYLSSILFLGYLIIMGDRKKRGFHDMLCDTVVVYHFNKSNNNKACNYYDEKMVCLTDKQNDNTEVNVTDKHTSNDGIETDNIEFNIDKANENIVSEDIVDKEKNNANNVNKVNEDVDNLKNK